MKRSMKTMDGNHGLHFSSHDISSLFYQPWQGIFDIFIHS